MGSAVRSVKARTLLLGDKMVAVGMKKTKERLLSPTPKSSVNKKSSGVRNCLIWIIICISSLLVICLLSFLQGKNEDNVTDLPRLVRDYLMYGYEVSRDNIKLMIPWTNKFEDVSEINDDSNGVLEESGEDDLYEDWARYDEKLRERWTKFVEK